MQSRDRRCDPAYFRLSSWKGGDRGLCEMKPWVRLDLAQCVKDTAGLGKRKDAAASEKAQHKQVLRSKGRQCYTYEELNVQCMSSTFSRLEASEKLANKDSI